MAARRSVVTERRETAIIGSAELLDWNALRCLQDSISHFFCGLYAGGDLSDDPHEYPLMRFHIIADELQNAHSVPFA